jgi:hypothetical protein
MAGGFRLGTRERLIYAREFSSIMMFMRIELGLSDSYCELICTERKYSCPIVVPILEATNYSGTGNTIGGVYKV